MIGKKQAYSPECGEQEFSEGHSENPAQLLSYAKRLSYV
jgi:hypothetical protein